MRLNAEGLATHGLRVELPSPHDTGGNVLALGPSHGVTGTYEQNPQLIRLRQVQGAELLIEELEWHFAAGNVRATEGIRLEGALIDLEIHREAGAGVGGSIRSEKATMKAVTVHMGDVDFSGDLAVTNLEYALTPSGSLLISCDQVEVVNAQISFQDKIHLRVGRLELRHVRFALDGTQRSIELHGLDMDAVTVMMGQLKVRVDGGSLPRGAHWADGRVEIAEANIGRITVDSEDVLAPFAATPLPELPGRPHAPESERPKKGSAPFDLSFLDGLNGQVAVDLRVYTKIAVVRRDKTHHFRIAVTDGELNYRALEHDLGTLEDAFIDIRVRDGKLSIENDIPLLPFYYRSLVLFRIAPEDLERAEQERMVKLKVFSEWELPTSKSDRSSKRKKSSSSPVELRALDFENIDMSLRFDDPALVRLPGGGTVVLGPEEVAPLEGLTVQGAVRYRPEKNPSGEIQAALRGLHLGLHDLPIGLERLTVSEAHLGSVQPCNIGFRGLKPKQAHVVLHDVQLGRIVYGPPTTTAGSG